MTTDEHAPNRIRRGNGLVAVGLAMFFSYIFVGATVWIGWMHAKCFDDWLDTSSGISFDMAYVYPSAHSKVYTLYALVLAPFTLITPLATAHCVIRYRVPHRWSIAALMVFNVVLAGMTCYAMEKSWWTR